jgi:two-component system sensor histidine kinase AlgZ
MQKNNSNTSETLSAACYLPDFCHSETNLRLILVLELVAIVFALSSLHSMSGLVIQLALLSVLILWVGLLSAALLCAAKRFGLLRGTLRATLLSMLTVGFVTALISWLAFQVDHFLQLEQFGNISAPVLMLRFTAISLILFGLALRYFYFQFATRNMVKTESSARLQALQARIRPHFLFNSLNTIASLTHDEPDKAERAIEGLADLFRASMKADARISLADEIELTRDYIQLESLRLDDRLRVQWQLDNDLDSITLPALMLQPLVENAIYHGIEPQADGGEVVISIRRAHDLQIDISNPLSPAGGSHRPGNQMALENIRERLQLAYNGRAKIRHVAENDLYRVTITIPLNDEDMNHAS